MTKKWLIALSFIIGPFIWLYNYKEYKVRIWWCFALSILTAGIFYLFFAWPWAIFGSVFGKGTTNSRIIDSKEKLSRPSRFLVYCGAILHSLTILTVVSFGSIWLTYLLLGSEVFNRGEKSDLIRILVLTLLLILVFILALTAKLRPLKGDYLVRLFRRILMIITVICLVSSLFIAGSSIANSPNANCNYAESTARAISATYPIATDISSGTGFAVSSDQIVTAYHVIDGATEVYLNLTTGEIKLTILRVAKDYDLALLKSESASLDYVELDESYTQLDNVRAIGWPGNTFDAGEASVSAGIISRVLDNEQLQLSSVNVPRDLEIIQTDAPLNPGNSGGPIVGNCGVVGVAAGISDTHELGDYGLVSEQGIGYAVSARTVREALGVN